MAQLYNVRTIKGAKLAVAISHQSITVKPNDLVIIENQKGEELAKIVRLLEKEEAKEANSTIVKVASNHDINMEKENAKEAEKILEYAKKEANRLSLEMKFLSAEYTLSKSKLTLYFTAEDRVDFRDLVRSIVSFARTRVELRQIGPRDEFKLYPNLGICGRELCCRSHLVDFKSVTIKDAKEQGLQINMPKISGNCGKLMCCLKYEEEAYKENLKKLPRFNQEVTVNKTGEIGRVANIDILNLKVKVKFGDSRESQRYDAYSCDELEWKSGR